MVKTGSSAASSTMVSDARFAGALPGRGCGVGQALPLGREALCCVEMFSMTSPGVLNRLQNSVGVPELRMTRTLRILWRQ